jgi:hypothetical protein
MNCLRRSSVSSGMGKRIILPSFWGFSPMSEVSMARSIALIVPGSNGVTVSSRGSGTLTFATLLKGILEP